MNFIDAFEQADKELVELHGDFESLVNDFLCDLSITQWETFYIVLSSLATVEHRENPKYRVYQKTEIQNYKDALFDVFFDASKNYAAEIDKRMDANGYYQKKWEEAS